MYQAVIGKKIVAMYNRLNGTDYTAEQFWDNYFAPLFFNHQSYMLAGGNTPLGQIIIGEKYLKEENRLNAIALLKKKIKDGEVSNITMLSGGSADLNQTTSGLITAFDLPIGKEEIYAVWIGIGAGLRVGNLVLLTDKEEVLLLTLKGWARYRQILNENNGQLKGNQVEAWNTQWICFALNNQRVDDLAFIPNTESKEGKKTALSTTAWIKLIFELAKRYPNEVTTLFVYGIGQTNTTVGFVPVNLPEVKWEIDIYNKLIEFEKGGKKAIEEVYNTDTGFEAACTSGILGIKQLRPKGIRQYFPSDYRNLDKGKEKDWEKGLKWNNEDFKYQFSTYLSWLTVMIKSQILLSLSEEFSKILFEFSTDKRLTVNENKVKNLLASVNRTKFIAELTEIMQAMPEYAEVFLSLVKELDALPIDRFQYFVTLLRFQYVRLQTINKSIK